MQKALISIHAPREGSDIILASGRPSEWIFLSTLPARGATKAARRSVAWRARISIHAPREGSDQRLLLLDLGQVVISIHAPREGSDGQSSILAPQCGISIHAPREGSDKGSPRLYRYRQISIHAPREGSDSIWARASTWSVLFLSTLPARGATSMMGGIQWTSTNFYPRSPRGERP